MNETTKPAAGKTGNLTLTISHYFLIFVLAISMTMMGPLIPVYIQQYGITLDQGGLISLLQGLGALLAVIAGLFFSDKLKKTAQIKISMLVYSLFVLVLTVINSYALLVAVFFVIGASTKLLDTMLNASLADINASRRGFYINLLHASFGVGALVGPMLSILFIRSNIPVNLIFLSLGIACTASLLQFVFILGKTPAEAKIQAATQNNGLWAFMKDKKIMLLSVYAFLYIGLAMSLSTWMPAYMQQVLKKSVEFSGYPVSAFWLGVIIGRVVYSMLQEKRETKLLLTVCLAAGSALYIFSLLLNEGAVIVLACGIMGLVSGALVPLSVSAACALCPKNTGAAASVLFIWMSVAQLSIPWLNGLLVAPIGFTASMILIGVLGFAAAVLSVFLPSNKSRA